MARQKKELPDGFGRRLRDTLKSRDVSQAELSEATGIPKPTISRYASGARDTRADMKHVATIARALRVDMLWLSGEGDETDQADGSKADIDVILGRFPWPPELEPVQAARVETQLRSEHFKNGAGVTTQSYWMTRLKKLVSDELLGPKPSKVRVVVAEDADLTEESPEVRGGSLWRR